MKKVVLNGFPFLFNITNFSKEHISFQFIWVPRMMSRLNHESLEVNIKFYGNVHFFLGQMAAVFIRFSSASP